MYDSTITYVGTGTERVRKEQNVMRVITRSPMFINWIALLLALVWLGLVWATVTPANDDFKQYWQAAINIREHNDPYVTTPDPHAPETAAKPQIAFPNPPLLAYLMLPFSFTSAEASLKIWFGLNLMLLAGLIAICIDVSDSQLVRRYWGVVVLLMAIAPPTRLSLQLGQVSILLALLAAGTYWLAYRRAAAAGVLLAFGALIKLYPGFVGLFFLRCGPRRVAWWGAIAGIATLIISLALHGPVPYQEYLRKVLFGGFYPYAAEFNISLVGFFQRLLVPSRFAIPIAAMPEVGWGAALAAICTVAILCWWAGANSAKPSPSLVHYSVYLCGMLLIAPVNGAYNLVALLIPATAGIRALELQPQKHLRFWLVLGLALACMPPGWSAGLPFYETLHTGWWILLLSPAIYGLAIVFGVMVWMARSRNDDHID